MKIHTTKIQKLYSWMEARMPLGIPAATEFKVFFGVLAAASAYSIIHFSWYFDYCLGGLYADVERTILLSPKTPYVDMMPFWTIAKDGYLGFLIMTLILLWLAYFHYHYHYQKSKSAYLMMRLTARNELARRCLTLPITGLVITAVTALILTGSYYVAYINLTPPEFL